MSGTTVKTATAETSTAKTKKAVSSKKVSKTSARKSRGNSTGVKKKTTRKKTVAKKTAVKKSPAGKTSKKATGRKGVSSAQQREVPATEQTGPANDNSTPEDNRSLSWMSAQAASALKAVKASQAEKGQAVLARTQKQAAETHLDDDSLIRIAAEMPVDNDALVEFSTEQPLEENPQQRDAAQATVAATMDESSAKTDASSDSHVTPEPALAEGEDTEAADVTPPAEQAKPGMPTPPPPPQPAKRTVAFQPALAAVLLCAALVLGYYYWPGSDDNSDVVAIQESNGVEAPATVDEPVDTQDTSTNLTAVPPSEPGHETTEINNDRTASSPPNAWESSNQPQTAAIPATTEPEPSPVESVPDVAAQAPQPVQPAQPAVPAQPDRRAPAQGYYPQQRRPAYPQYYYR